jgi:YHS domain-containing protein
MTGSIHDQRGPHQAEVARPARFRAVLQPRWARRSWVIPVAAGGVVVVALVAAGVIPLRTVAFVAPLAGCLLMHLFMGHGAHGSSAGHGAQGGAAGHADAAATFDLVCRMRVDPAVAREQGLVSHLDGVDVFFCSHRCKDAFDGAPGRYVAA